MKLGNPLITIGITCYNAEDTISRAIESALKQNWPNLEIIIIDDHSTDNSVEKIKSQISGISSARLIESKKNGGAAKSRNQLINSAKGDYIVFFDDDDCSSHNRVSHQYNTIKAFNKKYELFCFASGKRMYPNGYIKKLRAIGSDGVAIPGIGVANYLLLGERNSKYVFGTGTPACSLMCRTDLLKRLHGFHPKLKRVEDVELAIRAGFENVMFIGTAESLFLQYSTTGSDKSALNNYRSEMMIVKFHSQYLKSIGKFHFICKWNRLRFFHFSQNREKFFCSLILLMLTCPILTFKKALIAFPKRWFHERHIN